MDIPDFTKQSKINFIWLKCYKYFNTKIKETFMTHREHSNACCDVVELLAQNGFDGMAQAIEILMNEAMKLERGDVLQAEPYERTDARRGYDREPRWADACDLIRFGNVY
jgi:hypothetical protein